MLSYQIASLLDGVGRRRILEEEIDFRRQLFVAIPPIEFDPATEKSSRRNRLLVRDNDVRFDAILFLLLCTKTFCHPPLVVSFFCSFIFLLVDFPLLYSPMSTLWIPSGR